MQHLALPETVVWIQSDGVLAEAEIWWTGLFRIQGAGDTTPDPVLSSFKWWEWIGRIVTWEIDARNAGEAP
jgi:hypothetical protein